MPAKMRKVKDHIIFLQVFLEANMTTVKAVESALAVDLLRELN